MADILNADGLQVKTAEEITTDLIADLKAIYGEDIITDQNSPNGQEIGIITQAAIDFRELAVDVNNGFDPDQAQGRILDQRAAINLIERKGGTYTIQPIQITVSQSVELDGLDADFNDPDGVGYSVQSDAGEQFILIDSQSLAIGTHTVNFRAKNIGTVSTTVGSITNPVTIVNGVTGILNTSAALEIGVDEETDAQLKVRRQRSTSIASTGYLDGLRGALLDVDGVSEAKTYDNNSSDVTVGDAIPSGGIWAIVEGGSNEDIAAVMYSRLSYGSPMKGLVSVAVARPQGGSVSMLFDRPIAQDLYIRFDIKQTNLSHTFDQSIIKSYLVNNLEYEIGQYSETSEITYQAVLAIASQGGGGVPINMEVSGDGSSWVDYIETTGKEYQFTLDASRVTITEV